MPSLLVATRNPHKTREFGEILGPRFAISDLTREEDIAAVEETGLTFEANAILKALAASQLTRALVVADDSGLEVTALGGAPGVRSARYAGEQASDAHNVARLLADMQNCGVKPSKWTARFCCVLALAREGQTLALFHGTLDGTITGPPRGQNGFGYDPVFVPRGFEHTLAELGPEVKKRISHRAQAIARLRVYLALRS